MKYLKILGLFSLIFTIGIASCSLFDFDKETNTETTGCDCINYEVCVNDVCECPEGYSGSDCQIDDCANVYCLHGGTCLNGECQCPDNYTGINCEIPIDPCAGVSCVNGDLDSDCDCNCDNGWIGSDCSTPIPQEYTFFPTPIENLCPVHIGGNREFGGAGPVVTINCTAYIVNDEHIYVDVYFYLIETHPDGTAGLYDGDIKIYTAPSGKKIQSIVSATESSANYTDTDITFDFPIVVGELVDSFKSMGDTWGDDLGSCIDDYEAELNIYFNPMTIKLVDK